jgi:hypothetical protein|tara:strand:- start:692 stop:1039 length:348 start_codon:yes stop_codon:yes gene_type:complete
MKFLDTLEHYELVRLKQGMEKGNIDIEKTIQQKIKEHEKKHAKSCTTCSNAIDSYNTNNYTVIFGPGDFRKKASFCGLDCLEYFLIKLKQMKTDAGKTEFSSISQGDDKNAEKTE